MFPTELKYDVKQEHIDAGIPVHDLSCPIALAVAEKYPDFKVEVGAELITLSTNFDLYQMYRMDGDSMRFVSCFDSLLDVAPFTGSAREFDA